MDNRKYANEKDLKLTSSFSGKIIKNPFYSVRDFLTHCVKSEGGFKRKTVQKIFRP